MDMTTIHNMSSSSDVSMSALDIILENFYRFGGPVLIILGTVSSVINLTVFIQKDTRENPCAIYFIFRNISTFFFIYLSLVYVTLVLGYNIYPNSSNLTYCHFSIYVSLLYDTLSPFYLILASIDRVLVTSLNENIRKRSTCRLACILAISGTIFWILFHIHALIYWDAVNTNSKPFHCDLQVGLYSTIVTYYTLIYKGILSPLLLILTSLWAMKNIRNTRQIEPVINIIEKSFSPKDQQLVPMLIKDIIVYIIFTSILSIVLMYELITQHYTKNFQQHEVEYFIRHLSTFWVSIPFCISCYLNLIVSKTFRKEVKEIFLCQ